MSKKGPNKQKGELVRPPLRPAVGRAAVQKALLTRPPLLAPHWVGLGKVLVPQPRLIL